MSIEKVAVSLFACIAAPVSYVMSWSSIVDTLAILMGVDFVIGLSMPLFFGKSKKDHVGWRFRCRFKKNFSTNLGVEPLFLVIPPPRMYIYTLTLRSGVQKAAERRQK
jgi:hypothetical protein